MTIVTWAVIGQALLGALIPWVLAFGFSTLTINQLWWIIIAIAVLVSYGITFGIGIAIHNESCNTQTIGSIASWSAIVPAINAGILLCIMNAKFLRDPIESLVHKWNPSEQLLFAVVASYYLFWSTAIGTTIAGYQATVC